MKRTLKRFFLALGIVLLVPIAGLAVFLATFDVDRYRPRLVRELEQAIQQPVQLERIRLGWRGGIAVQLQGLAIYEEAPQAAEPLVQIETASALIHLRPLLRREVQVASIVLTRPRIRVARDAQGQVNLLGLAPVAAPAAPGRAASGTRSPVAFHVSSIRVENGDLHWTDAATRPPTELRIKAMDVAIRNIAPGEAMDLEVKAALADEHPNLHLTGRLTLPGPAREGAIEDAALTIERLGLERLLPPVPPTDPQLRGLLSATLHGRTPTLDPTLVGRAATASGRLRLDEAVVANLNVLRVVFERLSMLPGLVQLLEARLPPEHRAKLAARDTLLAPLDVSLELEGGVLRFNELRIDTDTFSLSGGGRVGLDRSLAIRSTLRIDAALSDALIAGVNELGGLRNSEGRIELPLTIQGQAPRVAVLPDLNYVASKLLLTTAQDLLSRLLEKALDRRSAPDTAPEPTP